MNHTTLKTLASPSSKKPLYLEQLTGHNYLVSEDGEKYPIVQNIPQLFNPKNLGGLNARNRKFYDKISWFSRILDILCAHFINYDKVLNDRINDIHVKPNDKVLEVALGTGWNLKLLPKEAEYYGLDISFGTLKQCQKNFKRWNRSINLFQGLAEELPFQDNSFDAVFHIGGMGFFSDREKAILEMIRVAKSGTKIVIIDDTEDHIKNVYQKMLFVRGYYKDLDINKRTSIPTDLVPADMKDVTTKLLNEEGSMYQVSFIKP